MKNLKFLLLISFVLSTSFACQKDIVIDTDGDGIPNIEDSDDDNDLIPDYLDPSPLICNICGDSDQDGCDDCNVFCYFNPDNDDCVDCNLGQPCNDGNPCTTNDTYNSNCECVGNSLDTDGDGIANGCDECPNYNDEYVPCGALILYKHISYGGHQLSLILSQYSTSECHSFHDMAFADVASSLKYNLPEGMVVTLHEHVDCEGFPLVLTGSGEINNLGDIGSADDLSSFSISWE